MASEHMKNLFDYVRARAASDPGLEVFTDGETTLTASQVYRISAAVFKIFSGIENLGPAGTRNPVAVYMERGPCAAAVMIGVLGCGNYYIPLDEELGSHRIESILKATRPVVIITDATTEEAAKKIAPMSVAVRFEEIALNAEKEDGSFHPPGPVVPTDPAYIIFTSGTSGVIKGIVANHANVMSYLYAAAEYIHPHSGTVLGLQSSFCVDFCLWEMWYPFVFGARTVILPKKLYLSPFELIRFMNKEGVNTIHWVASAFVIVACMGVLQKIVPELDVIIFGGEVMPPAMLAKWREVLPGTRFIQCYGPTESTGYLTYFELPEDFPMDAPIPVGKPLSNARIFLQSEDGRIVDGKDEAGEICVSGPGISLGYYGNSEQSDIVFVQNPFNALWREYIYRTGDMAKYDENGDLVFITRKDYQIKHMGYRIDLLEIEAIAMDSPHVERACCVYVNSRIVLFYSGESDTQLAGASVKELLPRHMQPSKFIRIGEIPELPNGKIDRKKLISAAGLK